MTTRGQAMRHLEQELGVLVRRARRVIAERARAVHPDLQVPGYLMVGHLVRNGPARASVLAAAFDMDKGAVSRHVQQLLELGLVEGRPDPADGRATLLDVTPSGLERMDAVADSRRAWLDEQLGEWKVEDIEGFTSILGRYNQALGG